MKNATHRVVILQDLNSELISQAIIFLKDTGNTPETKILAEAEKIVEKYMKTATSPPAESPTRKKKIPKKSITIATATLLFVVVAVIAVILH